MVLASLAGINIGSMESSSEFPPTLYPQVVNGIPFQLDLLSSKLHLNNETSNVKDYFLEKVIFLIFLVQLKSIQLALPSLILGSFKDQEVAAR